MQEKKMFCVDGFFVCDSEDRSYDCECECAVSVNKDWFIKNLSELTAYKNIDQWDNNYIYPDSARMLSAALQDGAEVQFDEIDCLNCRHFKCKDEFKSLIE